MGLGLAGDARSCAAAGVAGTRRVRGSSSPRRQPIVDFDLFRNRPYLGASAAAFCARRRWWAVIFYFPQYLQNVLGYSAIEAGAADPADHRADGRDLAARAAR